MNGVSFVKFSVVMKVIETVTAATTGTLTRLSPQEIIDCAAKSLTCETYGALADGFIFAKLNGIEPLSSYPITNVDGTCYGKKASTGKISGYANAGSGNEQTMLNNFESHGPIAVAVDARNWQFYDGGKYRGKLSPLHPYADHDTHPHRS